MHCLSHLLHWCRTGHVGELGWSSLPRLDGNGCSTWVDVGADIQNKGLSRLLVDVRIKQPLVIRSQLLFEITGETLNAVKIKDN